MAFSSDVLASFVSAREKDYDVGGATWTLRELSGYQMQELQSMLLKADKSGASFDSSRLAAHYAQAIAHSVVGLNGERGELTVEQAQQLDRDVFNGLRDAIDNLNGKAEDEGN